MVGDIKISKSFKGETGGPDNFPSFFESYDRLTDQQTKQPTYRRGYESSIEKLHFQKTIPTTPIQPVYNLLLTFLLLINEGMTDKICANIIIKKML